MPPASPHFTFNREDCNYAVGLASFSLIGPETKTKSLRAPTSLGKMHSRSCMWSAVGHVGVHGGLARPRLKNTTCVVDQYSFLSMHLTLEENSGVHSSLASIPESPYFLIGGTDLVDQESIFIKDKHLDSRGPQRAREAFTGFDIWDSFCVPACPGLKMLDQQRGVRAKASSSVRSA